MNDELGVFVVVEELPHNFLIESFDPVVGQELSNLVLRDTLLVLPETPDGGPDAHEAVLELDGGEVKGATTDSNLITQVAVVPQPIVANDMTGVDVLFVVVGLDVVVAVIGERHHRTDVVDIVIVDSNLSR